MKPRASKPKRGSMRQRKRKGKGASRAEQILKAGWSRIRRISGKRG